MNNTTIHETSGINAFYAKIYSLVGVGVGISALVAGLMLSVFQQTIVQILMYANWIYYTAIVVELILVFFASSMASKNSPLALPVFLAYSALNGFTLSIILALYTQSHVTAAFVTASAMFFALAFIGKVTKKDLSGIGRACLAGLIGLIIAGVVNIFLRSSTMDFIVSIIGVVIFSGLIAWDNQKIRLVYEQTGGQASNGWAVSMALSLYLDFINLFLSLLRLFGRND
ncbi:Bax inhibitor-1/YccA family protein [Streptococcus oricebi]|uniref:BAX inhibitor (BI)-1/YccA family protein n=1 Tax=Streptococcus oricebi TaxID=1547447 RepID=A0ABS5B3M0_9STRE|nr:Bax inhibitor-1/YccA family protein [Streptococcus oricebi]MBP2623414.1 BAX inhibitor (BI)-1/YccA family protein [Streptococcus oricebi]